MGCIAKVVQPIYLLLTYSCVFVKCFLAKDIWVAAIFFAPYGGKNKVSKKG